MLVFQKYEHASLRPFASSNINFSIFILRLNPTYFVLSGAGASIDEKNDTQRNPTDAVLFEPGFVQMSLSPNTITFDIIDREGQVRSTHNMTTKTY